MNSSKLTYKRHRFPAEIIQYAVCLYYKFNPSHRDIEDLLAQRGIAVSCEAIRLWCHKFGSRFSRRLRRKHQGFGDTFFIDEVFVKIQRKQHYLWRAVDQGSYGVAHRELIPDTIHDTTQYANNRAELSREPTRVRERGMRKFKSIEQAQ